MKLFKRILPCVLLMILTTSAFADEVAEQLEARNSASYTENVITGGQPSAQDITKLAKAGVDIVINLRGENELGEFKEEELVTQNGMQYISLPIAGRDAITLENARKLQSFLADDKKVFLHCGSSNRVGALIALSEYEKNNSISEAIAEGEKAGLTSLKPLVESIMEKNQ